MALRTVSYSDTHAILTAYSREQGRVSVLVRVGAGREAARRRALLMPLSVAECTLTATTPSRSLPSLREVTPLLPLPTLSANPVKAQIALFVAEVLIALLRDSQPDEPTWRFLCHTIATLEALPSSRVANFPIVFLRRLTRYLGIEPSFDTPGDIFDMADGCFRATPPLHRHYLGGDEAAMARLLGRLTYDNMHLLRLTRLQRAAALDAILGYYTLHLAPLTRLTTLSVLRAL